MTSPTPATPRILFVDRHGEGPPPEFPNVAAVLGALGNEPDLVDRLEAVICAEIDRRQQMMADAATQSDHQRSQS